VTANRETLAAAMDPALQVEVSDDDVVLGVAPVVAYAPGSLADCVEVMALAARDRLRVGFVGGGTARDLGAAPRGLDAVVRTRRLARILEYAPADLVIVVEAGVTLAALQAEVAAHGQRLALDPPGPERATIGGLIATGGFGPLRTRYGAIRDLIIGVTLVRADAEVAHGGGKVVKNVAGFDLPKLVCGSLGTLGLVASAAFRLHPLPERSTTVAVPGRTADAVVGLIAAARAAQLEPARAVALGDAGSFELGVAFEGFDRGVADQVARFAALAAATGAQPLDDAAATALWLRHDAVRAAAPLRVRIAALPTRLPEVAALVAGLGALAWYPTLGLGFVGGPIGELAPTIGKLARARAALVGAGGSLVVETAPAELRAAIEPWGPPPPGFAIMARLKQRFDPDHRLNPGRFVGGL
jgi:glycolate oxidase FAD binding subunit